MRLNILTKPLVLLAVSVYASATCTYQGAYDSKYDLAIFQSNDCTGNGESYTLNDECGQSGTVHYSGHSIELGSECNFDFYDKNNNYINYKSSTVGLVYVAYGNIGTEIAYFKYQCPCHIDKACCILKK